MQVQGALCAHSGVIVHSATCTDYSKRFIEVFVRSIQDQADYNRFAVLVEFVHWSTFERRSKGNAVNSILIARLPRLLKEG